MTCKIINRLNIIVICTVLFLNIFQKTDAQEVPLNQYGLAVTANIAGYKKDIQLNKAMKMVRLKNYYRVYYLSCTMLLLIIFYTAVVYHAYRCIYANARCIGTCSSTKRTEKIWAAVKYERYAANPATGSGHNRGIAVDLTIIDVKTHKELNMGTGFDNFTDSAHHNFTQLPEKVLANRILLKTIIEKYGCIALNTEWWHYSLPDAKKYGLMNLDFGEFKK